MTSHGTILSELQILQINSFEHVFFEWEPLRNCRTVMTFIMDRFFNSMSTRWRCDSWFFLNCKMSCLVQTLSLVFNNPFRWFSFKLSFYKSQILIKVSAFVSQQHSLNSMNENLYWLLLHFSVWENQTCTDAISPPVCSQKHLMSHDLHAFSERPVSHRLIDWNLHLKLFLMFTAVRGAISSDWTWKIWKHVFHFLNCFTGRPQSQSGWLTWSFELVFTCLFCEAVVFPQGGSLKQTRRWQRLFPINPRATFYCLLFYYEFFLSCVFMSTCLKLWSLIPKIFEFMLFLQMQKNTFDIV